MFHMFGTEVSKCMDVDKSLYTFKCSANCCIGCTAVQYSCGSATFSPVTVVSMFYIF